MEMTDCYNICGNNIKNWSARNENNSEDSTITIIILTVVLLLWCLLFRQCVNRHWMVVRSNGDFVTQRQFPRMVLIQSEVGSQELVLKAPDMPSLTLPLCPVTDRSHVIKCRYTYLSSLTFLAQVLRIFDSFRVLRHTVKILRIFVKKWWSEKVCSDGSSLNQIMVFCWKSEKIMLCVVHSVKVC